MRRRIPFKRRVGVNSGNAYVVSFKTRVPETGVRSGAQVTILNDGVAPVRGRRRRPHRRAPSDVLFPDLTLAGLASLDQGREGGPLVTVSVAQGGAASTVLEGGPTMVPVVGSGREGPVAGPLCVAKSCLWRGGVSGIVAGRGRIVRNEL